ncbi:PREDICTED: uncharacterized protein LOC105315658 [Amphimedon queenslandica]|uniref:AIG1-type G domain-containing protein n=2 Tax=Amphimedon queenslandica TaxID=400682 RepID=A0AAN0ISU6_AMPQE|nr:PREDICTED: uncharacterized protein LOC105315658 [Amphimedon queenslandica]|eukprot:XP_011408678.1 PREDICTED: uncharacterized protein LOC105315658 [Amphimedon queenslandica]
MEAEAPISHTILLIGETGSGKTSFLNLLCNYGIIQELGINTGIQHFHSFNEIKLENVNCDKMQSKTSDALKYTVSLGDTNLEIIDTPGFGDSRGIKEDKNHVKRIIDALKKEDYVNCVCLIINGRSSRMSATLSYVLSEITSILPKTILNNIIVVFTNTTGLLQLSFDLGALKHYFGRNLEHSYCIENPYCLFEKANEKKGLMSKELLAESLKDEFERTAKTLNKLFATMKSFELVQTNDFLELYKKKEKIEETITLALAKYDTQSELKAEIEETSKKIGDAISESEYNEKFKELQSTMKKEPQGTNYHNTICSAPRCFSNCHEHCSIPPIFEEYKFKYCACIDGDYCTVCGHHYAMHKHLYFKYVDVKHTWWETNPLKEKRFREAKNAEERARLLKKELEEERDAIIKEKEKLFDILIQAIEEFQALGINRSFMKVLQSQVSIIEHHLEGNVDTDPNSSGAEKLEESKRELTKKIKIVKEANK